MTINFNYKSNNKKTNYKNEKGTTSYYMYTCSIIIGYMF